MKRRILTGILLLALLCALALPVSGTELPDLSRTGSIRLIMTYQDAPIAGGSLTLYRVAAVREADGFVFSPVAGLEDFDFRKEALGDPELPSRVLAQAKAAGLPGVTKKIGADGTVLFDGLALGLYLLEQTASAPGFAPVRPFLVSVPLEENGVLFYDVDATPKPEPLQPVTTEPSGPRESTEPTEETKPSPTPLPQTGQLNWPIPLLLVLGGVCLPTGLVLLLTGRRERKDEE